MQVLRFTESLGVLYKGLFFFPLWYAFPGLPLKLNATGGGKTDFQNFRFIAKFSLTVDNKGYAKIYKLSLSLGLDR